MSSRDGTCEVRRRAEERERGELQGEREQRRSVASVCMRVTGDLVQNADANSTIGRGSLSHTAARQETQWEWGRARAQGPGLRGPPLSSCGTKLRVIGSPLMASPG